jgi:predicted  nucleic acid-binding Zn-ribbon protein
LDDPTATQVLARLFELQACDAKRASLDDALAIHPATRAEHAEQKSAAIAAVESAAAKLEEAELEYRRMEAKLGDADVLRQRLEGQTASVNSNQAYTALMHEIEQAKTSAAEAEDASLELLDVIDEQRRQTESHRAALSELEVEIATAEERMKLEDTQLQSRRAAVLEQRTAYASDVERELLRQYEVAAGKHIDCIAYVSSKICAGCRISIPAQQRQVIRASNTPTSCPQCSRLLVSQMLYESVPSPTAEHGEAEA